MFEISRFVLHDRRGTTLDVLPVQQLKAGYVSMLQLTFECLALSSLTLYCSQLHGVDIIHPGHAI